MLGNFALLMAAFYAAHAFYSPYTVVYMNELGMSTTNIGLISTCSNLISIIMQPVWGMLCDRLRSVKKVMIGCLAVLVFLVPVLGMIQAPWLIAVWIPLVNIFFCSMFSFTDSWVVQGIKDKPDKTYGSFRVWGSTSFTVASAFSGIVAQKFGCPALFWVFSILALLTILVGFCIRHPGVDLNAPTRNRVRLKDMQIGRLLKNREYLILVLFLALIQIPMNVKEMYLTQRLIEAGGDNTLYGMLRSIGAVSEIPILIFSGRFLRRFRPSGVVRISMLLFALQAILFACPLSPYGMLGAQFIHGIGYSLFLVGSVNYLDELAPAEIKTSALTVASAVYNGIAGMTASSLGGLLIDLIGIMPVFRIAAVWSVCTVICYHLISGIRKKNSLTR